MVIHPSAIIHPKAEIASSASIGPGVVIDEGVNLGAECVVGPHVYLTGATTIGSGNRFHSGAVIGDAPQDLKYRGEPTRLVIGDENVFREHVTVHRATKPDGATIIGNRCLLMAGCHVGHNSAVGDQVIIANGALLAGHVVIQDQAFISGTCLIHQFVTVGTLALMQGGAAISLDLPPYCVARGPNQLAGLNTVGLRRAGFTAEQRLELRGLYQRLLRRRVSLRAALAAENEALLREPARCLLEFVRKSKRGVCAHQRQQLKSTNESEDN